MGNKNSSTPTIYGDETAIRFFLFNSNIHHNFLRWYFSKYGPVHHVVIHQGVGYVKFQDSKTRFDVLKLKIVNIDGELYVLSPCTISEFNDVATIVQSLCHESQLDSIIINVPNNQVETNAPSTSQLLPNNTHLTQPPQLQPELSSNSSQPSLNFSQNSSINILAEEFNELKQQFDDSTHILEQKISSLMDIKRVLMQESNSKIRNLEAEIEVLNNKIISLTDNLSVLAIKNGDLMEENESYTLLLKEFEQLSTPPTQPTLEDCCICMEKKSNCAIYRCGHVCLCNECSIKWETTVKMCPVCRQRTESVLRLYF